jgi:hypothetical protein
MSTYFREKFVRSQIVCAHIEQVFSEQIRFWGQQ